MTGMSAPQAQADRLAKVAALGEPLRRGIYLFVASAPEAVSRDQAAERFGVSRAVAAFHLDKLADLGLLEVEFKRPPGRGGPGAGRPAKLYRASANEVTFSIPPREYELAARLLAEAVSVSAHEGVPVEHALNDTARTMGHSLGRGGLEQASETVSREALVAAVWDVLSSCGYEPHEEDDKVVLFNCPFHALAQEHRELVCGMNLALMTGLTEELAGAGLEARLDPHPGECCVRLIRLSRNTKRTQQIRSD
jgi:predicted ArsR family transcriptional regulator